MICPKCMVQMHQKSVCKHHESKEMSFTDCRAIGGGSALDESYTTWELKQCPKCARLVVEHYTCFEVEDVVTAEKLAKRLSQV